MIWNNKRKFSSKDLLDNTNKHLIQIAGKFQQKQDTTLKKCFTNCFKVNFFFILEINAKDNEMKGSSIFIGGSDIYAS